MSLIYKKITLIKGDITKLVVDAVVNAANSSLLGGGGVDGAIHSAAGPDLLEECRELGGCEVGEAKITKAYDIETAKAIIHTVGPQIGRGVTEEDRQLLHKCYLNSLNIAKEYEMRSIAFPCISTGIYRFPKEDACEIALQTTKEWLGQSENDSAMDKIIFCFFQEVDEEIYKRQFPQIFGLIDDVDEKEGKETEEVEKEDTKTTEGVEKETTNTAEEVEKEMMKTAEITQ